MNQINWMAEPGIGDCISEKPTKKNFEFGVKKFYNQLL